MATRLLTHTQVLDDSTAFLTGASAREFADGILAVLTNTARAEEIGSQARLMAETKYSYETYLERTRQACAALHGDGSERVTVLEKGDSSGRIGAAAAGGRDGGGEGDGIAMVDGRQRRNDRRGGCRHRGNRGNAKTSGWASSMQPRS